MSGMPWMYKSLKIIEYVLRKKRQRRIAWLRFSWICDVCFAPIRKSQLWHVGVNLPLEKEIDVNNIQRYRGCMQND